MAFNIRCISCGAVVNHRFSEYLNKVAEIKSSDPDILDCKGKALDSINIFDPCCRLTFLTHETTIHDTSILYKLPRYSDLRPENQRK